MEAEVLRLSSLLERELRLAISLAQRRAKGRAQTTARTSSVARILRASSSAKYGFWM
jgi:hypothetical protein